MTKHMTGTREEWTAARLELLDEDRSDEPLDGGGALIVDTGSISTREVRVRPL